MGERIGELANQRNTSLLLVAFVLLASAYSVVNPLYEGSDELRHFRFVRVLAETGKLPVQGQEPKRSQSHHPPLYYAISAALTFWIPNQGEPYLTRPENPFWGYRYWEVGTDNKNMFLHGPDEAFPWYGAALAAHIARFVNVILGALTVVLTALIMFTIFPRRPALGYGTAGLVAFNPMFLYMSGAINNDVAAAAAGAALTLVCTLILRDGLTKRWVIVLGISFGLALLAKFNLAFFLPLAELVILYRSIIPRSEPPPQRGKGREALHTFLLANAIFLGLTTVIAGWWFVRNQVVYSDPTGFRAVTELWGVRDPWESFGLAWSELPNAWRSLWGRFGYGQIPLPDEATQALAWAAAAGGLGSVMGIVRLGLGQWGHRSDPQPARLPISQLFLLLLAALTFFIVLFVYMLVSPAGSMGRFFFPGLPAFLGLIIFGWTELAQLATSLIERVFRPAGRASPTLCFSIPALTINLAMLAFALWALLNFLAPAYAIPAKVSAADIPHNLDVILSDLDGPLVRLLNYEMDADSIQPGESLHITLTWQIIRPASHDYVIFLHLLDETEIVVAQRDTYPGLGNYPTSHWQPGHTFVETYQLYLPETAYAPSKLTPQVGLYSRDWSYRLETGSPDRTIKLRPLTLNPLPGGLPNPQNVNFDGQVQLIGYQISPRKVRPGEGIVFQFYWQAEQRPTQNYGIFLHVLGEENRIWAGYDAPPGQSMLDWPLETPIEDKRLLIMPKEMPPGVYQVEIGVWSIGTGQGRLPIVAEDGHWIDDHLLLGPVRLLPPE